MLLEVLPLFAMASAAVPLSPTRAL